MVFSHNMLSGLQSRSNSDVNLLRSAGIDWRDILLQSCTTLARAGKCDDVLLALDDHACASQSGLFSPSCCKNVGPAKGAGTCYCHIPQGGLAER